MSTESDAMREQLLGYLLRALEAHEQHAVEQALEADPRLREELDRLTRCLEPLHVDREHHAAPAGLAARTCEIVVAFVETSGAEIAERAAPEWALPPARGARATEFHESRRTAPREIVPAALVAGEAGGATRGLTLNDVIAIAGICLAAAFLFFPAISTSRFNSQLALCQNNLRQLGLALTGYSRQQDGNFPAVPVTGKLAAAGIYAPVLAEKQLLIDHHLVLCPSSEFVSEGEKFRLPTLQELEQATGATLAEMQRRMGGSYGYNLGYLSNGRHYAPRYLGRAHYALMADAPDRHRGHLSSNHGGCGQNVLFEDGHVQYLTGCVGQVTRDDIFLNDRGEVAAGMHEDDAVIAASAVPPMPLAIPVIAP